ncbi:MAG TPA: response regulator [Candidatus Methanoperedens sp.]|nr:response regulator [Candidatus Methanoperedens sp.]
MGEATRGTKVLIVDDEPFIVETVRFALEKAGYDCLVAYDGEEAIKLARTENPGLILLDIMLPRLNGFQVCRLLKFDGRYRHIPIIMLTARTQARDRLLGKETGADEYVAKPFELPDLIQAVGRHLPPSAPGAA